jgi:hypothetical protein
MTHQPSPKRCQSTVAGGQSAIVGAPKCRSALNCVRCMPTSRGVNARRRSRVPTAVGWLLAAGVVLVACGISGSTRGEGGGTSTSAASSVLPAEGPARTFSQFFVHAPEPVMQGSGTVSPLSSSQLDVEVVGPRRALAVALPSSESFGYDKPGPKLVSELLVSYSAQFPARNTAKGPVPEYSAALVWLVELHLPCSGTTKAHPKGGSWTATSWTFIDARTAQVGQQVSENGCVSSGP